MSQTFTLTPEQRAQFAETGVVRVPGVIPEAATAAMADRLWEACERLHGVLRAQPETWTKHRVFQFNELRRDGAFLPMRSPGLEALLDDFFGERGWAAPQHWGGPLVTFPSGGEWTVTSASWHLDILPGQPLDPWPSVVRVFTFLEPAPPGGGGTLYVAGSARLAMALVAAHRAKQRSAKLREAMKRASPWVAELCSAADNGDRTRRFMHDGSELDGVPLLVGEMTGEPGDVWLMHPGTLHAGAMNCGSGPRMMLAETINAAR
jgi:Phytanoyl-CoA dioxygenase (PhyH)